MVQIWQVCVVSLLVGLSAGAQPTYRLQNYWPSMGIDAPVFDAVGNRLSGPTYAAELWGGVSPGALAPTVDFDTGERVIVPFLEGTGAGYFVSLNRMSVPGAPSGGFAWVQVRAWDTRLGSTYEQAAELGLGGYGESSTLYLQGGDPLGLPPTPASPLFGLESFRLRPVIPEPGTWALMVAGGGFVVWRRSRSRQTDGTGTSDQSTV